MLKPLCGDEPGLHEALRSFVTQTTSARLRFVFGVRSASDPAARIVADLRREFPLARLDLVIDERVYGANPKVSNLINMAGSVDEDIIVVSDSDVVIAAGALDAVVRQLDNPGVGAATCLFRGRPGARRNYVSDLGALYIDGWFLPTAILHARLASPSVCYGPLTAIRRDVLDAAGGFLALRDCLADDTELGHLTRRQGWTIAIAPVVAETLVPETSITALFEHELRWAKTIRALQPAGYLASIFMHPGPLPLALLALQPSLPTVLSCSLLLMLRWALLNLTWLKFGSAPGLSPPSLPTLWLRGQIYFWVWICGFFGSDIRWRGRALRIGLGATVERPVSGAATFGVLSEA